MHLDAGWLFGIDAAQAGSIIQGQDALQAADVGQHCGALVELAVRLAQLGSKADQAILGLHPAELSERRRVRGTPAATAGRACMQLPWQ